MNTFATSFSGRTLWASLLVTLLMGGSGGNKPEAILTSAPD